MDWLYRNSLITVLMIWNLWQKPTEGKFPAFQFLADLPGLFSVRGSDLVRVHLLTRRRFVVGKRNTNTSPHTHLGLSCYVNTCNLTAIWFSVIVCPMYWSGAPAQAVANRTIRSASYSFRFENTQRSLYFNVRPGRLVLGRGSDLVRVSILSTPFSFTDSVFYRSP